VKTVTAVFVYNEWGENPPCVTAAFQTPVEVESGDLEGTFIAIEGYPNAPK
jgi:hypothetical protein